jgi:hypothetical protein
VGGPVPNIWKATYPASLSAYRVSGLEIKSLPTRAGPTPLFA